MTYGVQVRNADGVLIVDTEKRSMEAFSWGSMTVPNRDLFKLYMPANCIAPIVFIRRPATLGLLVRGNEIEDSGGRYVSWSADRDYTVEYMVAGFRTNAPAAAQTGYGYSVFDGQGRLTFSTNLAYPRFPYRSVFPLQTLFIDPNRSYVGTMVAGGSPSYQHPAWGPNDWLYWSPMPFWERDTFSNWHLGLWFGEFGGDPRRIETGRVNITNNLEDQLLGSFFGGVPGTNIVPPFFLSCNFLPPT